MRTENRNTKTETKPKVEKGQKQSSSFSSFPCFEFVSVFGFRFSIFRPEGG